MAPTRSQDGDENDRSIHTAERFRDFADLGADWFWETDRNYRCVFIHTSKDMFGFDPDTMIGRDLLALYRKTAQGPDATPGLREEIHALENRRAFSGIVRPGIMAPDRWIRVSGRPLRDENGLFAGFRMVTRDITDQVRADRRTSESEARFRSIFDHSTVAHVVIDETGTILSFNPAAERMFQWRSDAVTGRNVSMLMTPADAERHDAHLRRYRETGEARIIGRGREVSGRRRDGSSFPIHLGIGEIVADGARQFIGTLTDLSEIKALETQVHQMRKLEALDLATGEIAHDFNNILGVIQSQIRLLMAGSPDGEERRERLERALDGVHRGAELTRKLLGRPAASGDITAVAELRSILAGIELAPTGPDAGPIDVEVACPDDIWPIAAAPGDLQDALYNLAFNARDAMPGGGLLEIAISAVTLEPGAVAGGNPNLPPGDYVRIVVKDTGYGMEPDILSRIFDPFFTTRRPRGGTGLGLSMVHRFAEQAGGAIEAHSRPGAGTRFILVLPRADASPGIGRERPDPLPEGRETILVVDDEPDICEYAKGVLDRLGYRTRQATSYEEALACLAEDRDFALLLTDYRLAVERTGLDLAATYRDIAPSGRVLVTSGNLRAADIDAELAAGGAVTILDKPFTERELAVAVRAALDR